MKLILCALVTAILYFIFSFLIGIGITAISLVLPFIVIIAKVLGIILGAIALVFSFLIASAILGTKVMVNIIKLIFFVMMINFAFSIIGWIITPLAAILDFLFPFICVYLIAKVLL